MKSKFVFFLQTFILVAHFLLSCGGLTDPKYENYRDGEPADETTACGAEAAKLFGDAFDDVISVSCIVCHNSGGENSAIQAVVFSQSSAENRKKIFALSPFEVEVVMQKILADSHDGKNAALALSQSSVQAWNEKEKTCLVR